MSTEFRHFFRVPPVTVLGTVEIGGTKTDVAFGTSPDDLSPPFRIATTDPGETLAAVAGYFAAHPVDALGVAAFGPLDLTPSSPRYGTILATPKPGWSGLPLHERLRSAIDVPIAIDTDVNGAALGEGKWGAAQGMSNFAYVTVGTGIGAGIVVAGHLLAGERHPEMGHIPVRRLDGDTFAGNCPYHGDCLEGMAAGPSLEARFGPPHTWAGNEIVVGHVAHYLAQGVLALAYVASPERVVIGGGVASLPWLHDRVRSKLVEMMGGYPEEPDPALLVSAPGLGGLSGLAGGLVLAETAV